MFAGHNVIVLDCETQYSATELPTGWRDLRALGLSVGGYYDYADGCVHWFDLPTLVATCTALLERQPLIVSFNGRGFDAPLMDVCADLSGQTGLAWADLWARSYDLLAEIWQVVGASKYTRGIHSLDALCQANGLGGKTGSGTLAPQLWQAGRVAEVLNYCQHDMLLTKALCELVAQHGGQLQRTIGPVALRYVGTDAAGRVQLLEPQEIPWEKKET